MGHLVPTVDLLRVPDLFLDTQRKPVPSPLLLLCFRQWSRRNGSPGDRSWGLSPCSVPVCGACEEDRRHHGVLRDVVGVAETPARADPLVLALWLGHCEARWEFAE